MQKGDRSPDNDRHPDRYRTEYYVIVSVTETSQFFLRGRE